MIYFYSLLLTSCLTLIHSTMCVESNDFTSSINNLIHGISINEMPDALDPHTIKTVLNITDHRLMTCRAQLTALKQYIQQDTTSTEVRKQLHQELQKLSSIALQSKETTLKDFQKEPSFIMFFENPLTYFQFVEYRKELNNLYWERHQSLIALNTEIKHLIKINESHLNRQSIKEAISINDEVAFNENSTENSTNIDDTLPEINVDCALSEIKEETSL